MFAASKNGGINVKIRPPLQLVSKQTQFRKLFLKKTLYSKFALKDLPNLSFLCLLSSSYIGEILQFPNRGFQNLKQILLESLLRLKSIVIEDGALPSLEKLQLVFIPRLKKVPSSLNKLPKLEVFHVTDMSDEFEENFHLNRGQRQWIIGVLLFLCRI